MGVDEPLFGSGPVIGSADESNLFFVLTSDIGRLTFEGHRSGRSIVGTYEVAHQDGTRESGRFVLKKESSRSSNFSFDSSKCPTDAEFHMSHQENY